MRMTFLLFVARNILSKIWSQSWRLEERILHSDSSKRRTRALPLPTLQPGLAIRILQALDPGQVDVLRDASHVRRVQFPVAFRAFAGRRVGNNLTDGVGAALCKVHAGIGAFGPDAGRFEVAVVVEVTSVDALLLAALLVRHADLSEWTIRVPSAAGQTNSILWIVFAFLAKFTR